MPKHHTDQNVVGLHNANHGFTIVSFPPTHKANNETVHTGHKQRRMADGGIEVVDVTTAARRPPRSCHCGLVVSLHPSSPCGSAPPDPNDSHDSDDQEEEDNNDEENNDDNEVKDNNDNNTDAGNDDNRSCRRSIPPWWWWHCHRPFYLVG